MTKSRKEITKRLPLLITWSIPVLTTIYTVQSNIVLKKMEMRPYFSIVFEHQLQARRVEQSKDVFYGNNVIVRNDGKIPATEIDTKYYITTDKDIVNMNGEEWFAKALGGFPSITFMPPQTVEKQAVFRSLSPSADYYYFEALATYEGFDRDKKYWCHIRNVYHVDRSNNVLLLVFARGDWDRNELFKSVPRLATKDEVELLLKKIKDTQEGNLGATN